jgi:hypothetical protein
MTDRELMQQALDALKVMRPACFAETTLKAADTSIVALRDRLAQPKTPDVTPEVTPYVIDCPRCGHCCPQPNQEPVAWGVFEGNLHDMFFSQAEAEHMALLKGLHAEVRPLYTAPPAAQAFWDLFDENQRLRAELKFNTTPPQRQWVGLTDEDLVDCESEEDVRFVRAIEAKLKEKNT